MVKSMVKHFEHVVQKVSLSQAVQTDHLPASASQVARVVRAAQVSKG